MYIYSIRAKKCSQHHGIKVAKYNTRIETTATPSGYIMTQKDFEIKDALYKMILMVNTILATAIFSGIGYVVYVIGLGIAQLLFS